MLNFIIVQITFISASAISTDNTTYIPAHALASGRMITTVITLLVLLTSTMVIVTNAGSTSVIQDIAAG